MSTYRPESSINQIIIHCADVPNGRWTTADDIDRWHGERGFKRDPKLIGNHQPKLKHIGYHFVIYINGALALGRHIKETGAHAAGHNTRSIGICLIGRDKYSRAQWDALKYRVTTLQNQFKGARVIGHRQVNPGKTCPGFDVQAWIDGGMEPLAEHILEDAKEEPK